MDEWLALLEAAGAPAARVNFAEEMTGDSQANADNMFLDLEHTVTGPQKVVGPLVKMSATPTGNRLAAPTLGEHTREILLESGLGEESLAALAENRVVFCA